VKSTSGGKAAVAQYTPALLNTGHRAKDNRLRFLPVFYRNYYFAFVLH